MKPSMIIHVPFDQISLTFLGFFSIYSFFATNIRLTYYFEVAMFCYCILLMSLLLKFFELLENKHIINLITVLSGIASCNE